MPTFEGARCNVCGNTTRQCSTFRCSYCARTAYAESRPKPKEKKTKIKDPARSLRALRSEAAFNFRQYLTDRELVYVVRQALNHKMKPGEFVAAAFRGKTKINEIPEDKLNLEEKAQI